MKITAIKDKHDHSTDCGCALFDARRIDPTQTTGIRKAFEADLVKRFRTLKGLIRQALVVNDVLGLRKTVAGIMDASMVMVDASVPAPRAFAFNRSDEKVSQFMQWLTNAEDLEVFEVAPGTPITSTSNAAWANKYVESAYQRGIKQSAARLVAEGANVAESWVVNAFTRPIHADRLALAYTRTLTELKGITDVMDQQISRILANGVGQGKNPLEIAREINDRVDKIGIARARVLARSEAISAHAEASLNTYQEAGIEGVDVEAEVLTAAGACPICLALAEQGPYTINQARGLIPAHPNCLPANSFVLSRSGVSKAFKRWFDGDMVVIKTASGRELTSTPNHPVLTRSGWIASEGINLGDEIVCDGGVEWVRFINGDDQDVISSIHDVAESVFRSGEVPPVPVPVSPEHFHGDGAGSEVAIIGTNSGLLIKNKSSVLDSLKDRLLKIGRGRLANFLAFGSGAKIFNGTLHSSNSGMGVLDLIGSLIFSHFRPLNRLGFGLISGSYSSTDQKPINHPSIEPQAVGDGLSGLSSQVPLAHLIAPSFCQLHPGEVLVTKDPNDDFARDAVLAAKLINGESCKVFFDKIVSVERFSFSGHVYNLETGEGWYSANGIITHNCRCALVPKVVNGTGIELI